MLVLHARLALEAGPLLGWLQSSGNMPRQGIQADVQGHNRQYNAEDADHPARPYRLDVRCCWSRQPNQRCGYEDDRIVGVVNQRLINVNIEDVDDSSQEGKIRCWPQIPIHPHTERAYKQHDTVE